MGTIRMVGLKSWQTDFDLDVDDEPMDNAEARKVLIAEATAAADSGAITDEEYDSYVHFSRLSAQKTLKLLRARVVAEEGPEMTGDVADAQANIEARRQCYALFASAQDRGKITALEFLELIPYSARVLPEWQNNLAKLQAFLAERE